MSCCPAPLPPPCPGGTGHPVEGAEAEATTASSVLALADTSPEDTVGGASDQRLRLLFFPANCPVEDPGTSSTIADGQCLPLTLHVPFSPLATGAEAEAMAFPSPIDEMELARGIPGSAGGRTYTAMITEIY